MNILIRSDSSSTIGTGHIMRDLVLAQQFSKDQITFATQQLYGNINHKIIEQSYSIEPLQTNNFQELALIIKKLSIDMIIIDHYEINYNFEKEIKNLYPHIKIMVLDDTYEKHYCDILLNHNISANPKKYKNKVPQNCILKCGAKYTLLREEFYQEKKKKNHNTNKKKIVLISLGGTDNFNLNIKILKLLQPYKNLEILLTTTRANKNLKNLKQFVKNKKSISLFIETNNMAKLMAKSDLAIITPSVIVNEAYFMNLPFIAIKVSENQNDIFQYLKKQRIPTLKKHQLYKLKGFI